MKYIIKFLIIILSTSCVSHNSVYKNTPTQLEDFQSVNIDGTYKNCLKPDNDFVHLWTKLYDAYSFKGDKVQYSDSSVVKIETIDNQNIKATLIDNGKPLQTITLKGKTRTKYFTTKNLKLIPIIFFYYIHKERTILIGKSKSSDLIIKEGALNIVWILMSGDTEWEMEFIFPEIKN